VPDGDGTCTNLLKFALNEQNFENTLIAFVVSMSSPWCIMDSLKKWSTIITDHMNKLNISESKRQEYMKKQVRSFQSYQDPDEKESTTNSTSSTNTSNKTTNSKTGGGGMKQSESTTFNTNTEDDDNSYLPLDQPVLIKNLGLPVVVIVTKVKKFIFVLFFYFQIAVF
jgi:dynein light intermediate chain 1